MAKSKQASIRSKRNAKMNTVRRGAEPAPKPHHRAVYPFHTLDKGEGFYITVENPKSVRVSAIRYGQRHGQKFTVSRVGDELYVKRLS